MSNRITRRPTPREPEPVPRTPVLVLVLIVLCIVLAVVTWFLRQTREQKPTVPAPRRQSSLCATYTFDGEVVRWYVFEDPDSGAQWVYNDHDWRAFPRVDRHGRQLGTVGEREVTYDD